MCEFVSGISRSCNYCFDIAHLNLGFIAYHRNIQQVIAHCSFSAALVGSVNSLYLHTYISLSL